MSNVKIIRISKCYLCRLNFSNLNQSRIKDDVMCNWCHLWRIID